MRTVDVHVRRLREKIEPSPSDPKYVHTKWGVGEKIEPSPSDPKYVHTKWGVGYYFRA